MAIFHCHVTPVSRAKGGSAKSAEEYVTKKSKDKITHITDYTNGKKTEREYAHELWSEIEKANRRCDARLALRVVIAIPQEITEEERAEVIEEISKRISEEYGVLVTAAVHEPDKGDKRNVHAHMLLSTNRVDKTVGRKNRTLDSPAGITRIRELYQQATNRVLERYGIRISGARVIGRPTRVHLGPAATRLERAGVRTAGGDHNRRIEELSRRPECVWYVARERGVICILRRDDDGQICAEIAQRGKHTLLAHHDFREPKGRVVIVSDEPNVLENLELSDVWVARPPRDDEERHTLRLAAGAAILSAKEPRRQDDLARQLIMMLSPRERSERVERDTPARNERRNERDDTRGGPVR